MLIIKEEPSFHLLYGPFIHSENTLGAIVFLSVSWTSSDLVKSTLTKGELQQCD